MTQDTISAWSNSDSLIALADRAKHGDDEARDEFHSRLEGSLATMVRLALRRGVGLPPLVRWAKQTLAALAGDRRVAPEHYDAELSKMLCTALLKDIQADSSRLGA